MGFRPHQGIIEFNIAFTDFVQLLLSHVSVPIRGLLNLTNVGSTFNSIS